MSSRALQGLRYRLPDEPAPGVAARFAISPFWLLPLTMYLTFAYSVLFLLLPGLNALLVGGYRKWRGVGLSVLALFILFVLTIARSVLKDAGLLPGITSELAADFVSVACAVPILFAVLDQSWTISLRKALRT